MFVTLAHLFSTIVWKDVPFWAVLTFPPYWRKKKSPPPNPSEKKLPTPPHSESPKFNENCIFFIFLSQDLFRKCQKHHFSGGACGGLEKSRISCHFVFLVPPKLPPPNPGEKKSPILRRKHWFWDGICLGNSNFHRFTNTSHRYIS